MTIQSTVSSLKPDKVKADLLVLPVYKDLQLGKTLPEGLRRALGVHIRRLEFVGEWGSAIFFPITKGCEAPFGAIIGLGDRTSPIADQVESMRRGVAQAVVEARKHELRSIVVNGYDNDNIAELAGAAVEAAELSNYRFVEHSEKLRKEQAARAVRKLTIVVPTAKLLPTRASVAAVELVLPGVAVTRDLVSQPASHVSPAVLVKKAQDIAADAAHINLKVLDKRQAEEKGFSAFLAVARGSTVDPFVIHMTYKPPVSNGSVAIVGKGVTFDSGGLSIKPADGMEDMKCDMAGAAVVLGLFSILEQLKPNITVHGIIAACENMPSGMAYRPGDVLTAKNGKTIEVLNTDAEGRITLADALSYAVDQKPQAIIDVATLTGACVVALGDTVAGAWSTDSKVMSDLKEAAAKSGEQICEMPMPAEYRGLIESQIADIANTSTSGRLAGAITAAMFLREFVGTTPWAHLDIAGPAFVKKALLPYYFSGATGYGVRLLAEFLKEYK